MNQESLANNSSLPEPETAGLSGETIYRVGTLSYTKRGLVMLFAWMLWGTFCFDMMEAVVPSIMPLKLRSLGSPNWIIALIMSTLPGIFNTTVCPWVSFKSDRYRSKWGRRIPFILYTLPFLTASLVFIGLSDTIGGRLHEWVLSGSPISRNMVVVFLLAVFAGMFSLFDMFVGSVYWYLFNDVVPEQFLSRFMSWFRLVGVLSSALYNYLVFPYALSHMREIYLGVATLYLVGFGLMCLRVKEGRYPPPPEEGQKPSLVRDIKTFARECYSIPYYWNIFLYTTFINIGGSIGVFGVFFSQSLGLDLSLIGKAAAVTNVVVAVCLIFAGILVDRWHPVRVEAYVSAFNTFFAFGSLIWLFSDAPSPKVYFWVVVLFLPFSAMMSAISAAAGMPRLMILFPKDRFGAFCGAMALVRSAGTMTGGLIAGLFLDFVKRFYPPGDLYPYRYMHIWICVFLFLGFYFNYRAYRYWKRLGGDTGYVPPTTRIRYADLPKATHIGVNRSLLILLLAAFVGMVATSLYYVYYFYVVKGNIPSTMAFGVYTGILFLVLLCYLWVIKFMERP